MNHRQRLLATMRYQPVDRAPLYDFNFWDETLPAWHTQGLTTTVNRANAHRYFGLDASLGGGDMPGWDTGVGVGLCPGFEPDILEDHGDTVTVRQSDGVIVIQGKNESMSIPTHVGHTLIDRASWQTHYKPRLDPDTPQRYPGDWDQRVKVWRDDARDHPVIAWGGSLFGSIRDWMGLEAVSMVPYDDPAWFEEMVTTCADLSVAALKRIYDTGAKIDAVQFWEDMACNAGPLLAPSHFKTFLVPQYRRISDLCRSHGTDILYLDCDGKIDDLIPLWLDAGIDTMFPFEVGTWGADPVAYRQRFGKGLRIMGGFDKHILAQSKQAITDEVRRLAPMVEAGGFIPFCDHRVPPDVPLDHYQHYCALVRYHWGRGTALEPCDASVGMNPMAVEA